MSTTRRGPPFRVHGSAAPAVAPAATSSACVSTLRRGSAAMRERPIDAGAAVSARAPPAATRPPPDGRRRTPVACRRPHRRPRRPAARRARRACRGMATAGVPPRTRGPALSATFWTRAHATPRRTTTTPPAAVRPAIGSKHPETARSRARRVQEPRLQIWRGRRPESGLFPPEWNGCF